MKTLLNIVRDHIRYRKQILKLAKADLVKTYKGAALGWSWAVIRPGFTIAVYYFAFSVGLRYGRPVGEYSFFLYLVAGLLPWFYISGIFTGGATSIRKYSYLVTKIRFPVSTIPTVVNLSKLITNILLTIVVMIIFILSGKQPDVYWLQIPVYILLMFVFFNAWSLFAGMLSVISKDFMQLVNAFVMPLFWLSGIIYDADKIENPVLRRVLLLNPVTFIANGYRNAFIYKVWFWAKPTRLRNFLIACIIMIILAAWEYRRLVKTIPDFL